MESTYPECAQMETNEYQFDEYNLTPLRSRTRTPRRQFTPGFRADVVRRIEAGEKVANISLELKVDQSNIYRWIENRKSLFLNENQTTPRIQTNPKGASYVRLEAELNKFVSEKRKDHKKVSKEECQKEALRLADICIDDPEERKKFKASMSWVKKFMIRKGITIRVKTKVSQKKKIDQIVLRNNLVGYLSRLRLFLSTYPILAHILNADETPMWFDMVGSKTLEYIGTKTVTLLSTGHDKTRFTVLLTISAAGDCLKAYVIFKGLKKVPNCKIPSNVVVNVNSSGTMDRNLMLDYLERVVFDYLSGERGALVMDSFKSHFVEEVIDYMDSINVKAKAILPGSTGEVQPLDVSVNKPFKGLMTNEWNIFMDEPTTDSDFTKGGNRKRPSYERLLQMVSNSLTSISQDRDLIKQV